MRAENRKSRRPNLILGLMLMLFTFQVLSPATVLAASAREIDRDARAVLAKLYQRVNGAKALGDKAVAVLVFPSIVKGGFIIAGNMATALCSNAVRPSPITARWPRPMDSKQGFKPLATCCFSWTMRRCSISITVKALS